MGIKSTGFGFFCIASLLASPSLGEPIVPKFTRIDAPPHVYAGGWEHFVGGGVASFDCNSDQYPELFLAGGTNPAQLLINQSTQDSLAFEARTPKSLGLRGVTGAYPLDVDSDGHTDLAILRVGADVLMRGLGDCQFAPFETLAFASADHWTTGFSATWEAANTLPTLAFGTYVDRSHPDGPFGTCDSTMLYRPVVGAYGAAAKLEPGFCALSMLFTDWNRNGRADLRISNDRHYYVRGGQEQLWAMEDAPRTYSESDGWLDYQIWGMGIASRDITGDGFADVYLTSMGDQKLQYFDPEQSGPAYRDATYARGTTAHRPYTGEDGRPSTGWHAGFGDLNNDGLDDIFVAKGNVEQMPGAAFEDPNNLLLQSETGDFIEAGDRAGIASMARSRGAALVDLNLDGWLDLAVVNRRDNLEIYQNQSELSGHWLSVKLAQPAPNTDAIGAFIELRTETHLHTREVTIGGGHASGDLGYQHFGLGTADTAEIRVIWPGGTQGDWQKVSANQHLIMSR